MERNKNFRSLAGGRGIFFLGCIVLLILPLILSDFRLNLLGKFLTFAIVALGIDLVWGYTGILTLGHAVFFSLGAYAMGSEYGYIYVREEYPIAVDHLNLAIGQANELGLLGEDILGTGFNFDLSLRLGTGWGSPRKMP